MTADLTYKTEQHPASRRWAIFEETDAAAYLYLTRPGDIISGAEREMHDVWVYNRIDPPSRSQLSNDRNEPPPACAGYVSETAYVRRNPAGAGNVGFLWSDDGEAVLVTVMRAYKAFLISTVERGFSRDLVSEGPWGHPWDETLFRRTFRPGIPEPNALSEEQRAYLADLQFRPGTTCPVCFLADAFRQPGGWETCPRCMWEDDPVQSNDPYYWGGPNSMCLFEARAAWLRGEKVR